MGPVPREPAARCLDVGELAKRLLLLEPPLRQHPAVFGKSHCGDQEGADHRGLDSLPLQHQLVPRQGVERGPRARDSPRSAGRQVQELQEEVSLRRLRRGLPPNPSSAAGGEESGLLHKKIISLYKKNEF